ncbi:fibrinogen-like YCDxxxxGGGW domain-containing protein [Leeuwenhoekiella sp. A16]|uniref:fibrinogen-like YCDxxxxGGGW domain-containing protein n=1 Tax=unclassified Leeuwenhoekiella TaxID=2615029 RepID=UPI003A8025BC
MIQKITILFLLFLINWSVPAYSQVLPQGDQLIAYYPFSGNADDSSGNSYNGVITGNPVLTADRFGNDDSAYSFDGDGDWIYFGDSMLSQFVNNTDDFTISLWAKSASTATQDLISYGEMVSCGGGRYGAIARLGDNIQFNSCNAVFNSASGGANSDDIWHQYIFVWNKITGRKVYKDGVQIGANTETGTFRIMNSGLALGRGFMDWPVGTLFNGEADELRLWKTALTATEVLDLYSYESDTANTISALPIPKLKTINKNGQLSISANEQINKNGAIGSGKGLSANGSNILYELNGLTQETAGISAYQIKQNFPLAPDGVYWISNSNLNEGIPFQVYADMTTDGGGWMLLNVGAGNIAAPQVSVVTSPDVLGYLPRTTVIELAKLCKDVQLRSGASSVSYAIKQLQHHHWPLAHYKVMQQMLMVLQPGQMELHLLLWLTQVPGSGHIAAPALQRGGLKCTTQVIMPRAYIGLQIWALAEQQTMQMRGFLPGSGKKK